MTLSDIQTKRMKKLERTDRIVCHPFLAEYKDDLVFFILVRWYEKNWFWKYENKVSQIFFSEKEALEAIRNNKVEWR